MVLSLPFLKTKEGFDILNSCIIYIFNPFKWCDYFIHMEHGLDITLDPLLLCYTHQHQYNIDCVCASASACTIMDKSSIYIFSVLHIFLSVCLFTVLLKTFFACARVHRRKCDPKKKVVTTKKIAQGVMEKMDYTMSFCSCSLKYKAQCG